MGKAKIIGMGIGIPVALILLVLVLNVYTITQLQFRGQEMENFDLLDMSMDAKMNVCNPTFFPASFNTLSADIIYKSTSFGTYTISGKTIAPSSQTSVDGRLKINGESVMQLVIAAFGSAFSGDEMDFDPNDMKVVMTLDAPILGIIPFSVSETLTADEFSNIISGGSNKWDC